MVDHQYLEVNILKLSVEDTTDSESPGGRKCHDETEILFKALVFLHPSILVFLLSLISLANGNHDDSAEADDDTYDFDQADALSQ